MTRDLLLTGGRVCAASGVYEPGWLLARSGRIAGVGPAATVPEARDAEQVDIAGATVLPGFIDIHVHGGAGQDVMDADPEGLRAMARFHASHGVTAIVPTTWAAPEDRIAAALGAVAEVAGPVEGGATILGAHLEGPWVNPARAGAQDLAGIRLPDAAEVERHLASGVVRLVTVAPEVPGVDAVIRAVVAAGAVASAGHTAAGWEEMLSAVEAGVSNVTHTFNAMVALGHRDPGTVGAALALDALSCEVIADGSHVHPAALLVLARAKGPERVILVSDALRAAGLPDGPVDLGGRRATCSGGAIRLPDGRLAGSALTLDAALANFAAATGWGWSRLWRVVAGNAAAALGLTAKGRIEVGADADLVVIDDGFRVMCTYVAGAPGPAPAGL